MTMKNRKTLAAVAVVLLALALVFVAPVSAEGEAVTLFNATGTSSYADLSAALTANDGEEWGVITLNSDLPLTSMVTISKSNITIDGNYHKIYASSDIKNGHKFNPLLQIGQAALNNITLKNIILDSDGKAKGLNIYLEGTGSVLLVNLFVNGSAGSGITLKGNATANNVTVQNSAWYQSIDIGPSKNSITDFGHIKMDSKTYSQLKDYVMISDEGRNDDVYVDGVKKAPTHNITEVISKPDGSNDYGARNVWLSNAQNFYDGFGVTAIIAEDGQPIKVYKTLETAVAAAEAGDTVTLQNNVALDSTLTIEKDVTITADDAVTITDNVNSNDAFAVTESGKLTLGNNIKITSTIGAVLYANGGEIIIDGAEITSGNSNYATVAVWNGGKLTILDGSIKSTATDHVTVSVKNAGSELIVNGGEINSITTSALAVLDSASATISGGTLTSSAEDRCVAYSTSNGVIKVTGGTLSGAHPWALIAASNGIVEVSGGTVDGVLAHENANAKSTISGGTINGQVDNKCTCNACNALDGTASMTITGGTFSVNPSAYIPSGYEVVQPGDKYLVQKYVDRSSSSSSSKPVEEPEQPEEPVVEPETPAAPGEVTVETEVTDGGEVELETPAAEGEGGSAAADEDEAKITGVVLPTGTDSEVTFVPVSEQPAPAGQEENTKKVFEINVPSYEKGKAAVIKFTMTVAELAADGKEAADVALWHFDEETGEWTKLVTTFTIVDGVVYFEAITEDFSPFAIIYEDEPAGDMPGNKPQDKPETPESPAPVLGLLAALGAAVVLRRK